MYWSYSTSKLFRRCPRQWFYFQKFASALSKDPERKFAYALKKLTTVSQWRGTLVDLVVSEILLPGLRLPRPPTLQDLKREATVLFERQLACARRHPIINRAFQPRDEKYFAVFHCQEYGPGINEEEIAAARQEVDRALENLYEFKELRQLIKAAEFRSPQRSVALKYGEMTVRGTPDLVLYFRDGPPVILDWKVHALGELDAWKQLSIYAVLVSAKRKDCRPEEIRLLEVQLLLGEIREHRLDLEDVERLHDEIAESIQAMMLSLEGEPEEEPRPEHFRRAYYADACTQCAFLRLCWPASNQPKLPPWP